MRGTFAPDSKSLGLVRLGADIEQVAECSLNLQNRVLGKLRNIFIRVAEVENAPVTVDQTLNRTLGLNSLQATIYFAHIGPANG